jgi:hypothetical protein
VKSRLRRGRKGVNTDAQAALNRLLRLYLRAKRFGPAKDLAIGGLSQ